MKKPSKKVPKVSVKAPVVAQSVVTLKLGDTTLVGTGETILDALRAIKKPVKIVTKSIITVTNGSKTFSRPLTVPMATRLFYPTAQIFHAKNFTNLLK